MTPSLIEAHNEKALNGLIHDLAARYKHCFFIGNDDNFKFGGQVNRTLLSQDGLHLSPDGIQVLLDGHPVNSTRLHQCSTDEIVIYLLDRSCQMLDLHPLTRSKMEKQVSNRKLAHLEKKKKKLARLNDEDRECKSPDNDSKILDSNTNSVASKIYSKPAKTDSIPSDKTVPQIPLEEYVRLKKNLKKRKKFFLTLPHVRLKEVGIKASQKDNAPQEIVPLITADIQHLIIFGVFGTYHPPNLPPRWCHLERQNKCSQIVVFIVEGLSSSFFSSNESNLPTLSEEFDVRVEFTSPYSYGSNIISDLASVKLGLAECKKLGKRYALKSLAKLKPIQGQEIIQLPSTVDPISSSQNASENMDEDDSAMDTSSYLMNDLLPPSDKFSRVLLLLSLHQMVQDNYPLPVGEEYQYKYSNYKFTKDVYSSVTAHSPMFGLDCEMCITAEGQELARITLVNEQYEVLYNNFVKPRNKILDYVTQYSGITKELLKNVTRRLEDVQDDIRTILPPDAILVGQSLNMDFQAMKMMHPYVIDTSVIYNLAGFRRIKPKLSRLADQFLNMSIQTSSSGHDSIEDSIASLKLAQLKLANGINFGDATADILSEVRERIKEAPSVSKRRTKPVANESDVLLQYWKREIYQTSSIFKHAILDKKTVGIVGQTNVMEDYAQYLLKLDQNRSLKKVTTDNNDETVATTCKIMKNSSFIFSHVRITSKQKKKELVNKIDCWVNDIKNSTKDAGMCIVLFPGEKRSETNGLAFVKIVKPPCPIPKQKPRYYV